MSCRPNSINLNSPKMKLSTRFLCPLKWPINYGFNDNTLNRSIQCWNVEEMGSVPIEWPLCCFVLVCQLICVCDIHISSKKIVKFMCKLVGFWTNPPEISLKTTFRRCLFKPMLLNMAKRLGFKYANWCF